MKNDRKQVMHICKYCKNKSAVVGIMQKEVHYYSFYLDTGQREDFHGDDDVEYSEFFCLNCNGKIEDAEVE